MAFFHTISRKLQFRTVEYIESENHQTILHSLQKVIKIYKTRGFNIEYICGGHQFEFIREDIRPILLKIALVGEHVPEVEQSIQTVKGETRTVYQSLPYNKFPPLMIKEMIEYQVSMRNKFPTQNGISKTMSPLSIITGTPNPSYSEFKVKFGQYAQVHDHPQRTNDMRARTSPAIALRASSSQNGWFFMSLDTGEKILRYKWTELPISTNEITEMHQLAHSLKLKKKRTNQSLTVNTNNEDVAENVIEGDKEDEDHTQTIG